MSSGSSQTYLAHISYWFDIDALTGTPYHIRSSSSGWKNPSYPALYKRGVCLYHCYIVTFLLWIYVYGIWVIYSITLHDFRNPKLYFSSTYNVITNWQFMRQEITCMQPQKWHSVWLMKITSITITFYIWKVDHPSYWWKQYLSHLLDKFILWSIVDLLPYFFNFSKLRNK